MPIVRHRGTLIYYAHVPKCAGSAVNRYLAERFGPVAMQDERFQRRPARERWTRSSPQHVDRRSLGVLFPEGFFDAVFTIVRHPVSRITSVYSFQREVERTIPEELGFSDWLDGLAETMASEPFAFDNHARPMDDIVPEGARVFRLEDGLDGLVGWLDEVSGSSDGPRAIAPANRRSDRRGAGEPVRPSGGDLALIEEIYGRDFVRFGYEVEAPARPAAAAPARRGWLGALRGRD